MTDGAAVSERVTESGPAGSPASSSWPRRYGYHTVRVDQRGSVAWVHLQWPNGVNVPQLTHRELAECLHELRRDDEVRIVVLRGTRDDCFMSPFAGSEADGHMSRPRGGVMSDPHNAWALAWTKAAVNRQLCADLAISLDASAALLGLSMRVRDEFGGPRGIAGL